MSEGDPRRPDATILGGVGALPLLYVDDEPDNLELFEMQFGDSYSVRTAAGAPAALELLENETIGLLLTDERMPVMSGIQLLARVAERWPDCVRVIVSAYNDADRLLRAINVGHAHEYVLKPWRAKDLAGSLDRWLSMAHRRRALRSSAELATVHDTDLKRVHDPTRLVTASADMQRAVELARKAGAGEGSVLFSGETGTGKTLLARVVHEASRRRQGPFVTVSVSGRDSATLETEVFGDETRRGRLELADGGTLFLQGVDALPPRVQAELLRALEDKEAGQSSPRLPMDVRILGATRQPLRPLVSQGSFMEALFFRLAVIEIDVPPLRDRPEDLPDLVRHFVTKHATAAPPDVAQDALNALAEYGWPGNAREVENLVQRALLLSNGKRIELDDFCLRLDAAEPSLRQRARDEAVEELRHALVAAGGNCARAARALGIPRTTLISRARKHGLL